MLDFNKEHVEVDFKKLENKTICKVYTDEDYIWYIECTDGSIYGIESPSYLLFYQL